MAELYPFKDLAPKWHLAYFGRNIGNFGHNFKLVKIWTLFLFCPSFRSRLMGKPIFRPNGPILAILRPKKPQKTTKMAISPNSLFIKFALHFEINLGGFLRSHLDFFTQAQAVEVPCTKTVGSRILI